MFDIAYSPWLILALVGLIFFRPDDWQDLAFHGGRFVRRVRAYALEWQEYIEFPGIEDAEDSPSALIINDTTIRQNMIWPQAMPCVGACTPMKIRQHSHSISVPPHYQ